VDHSIAPDPLDESPGSPSPPMASLRDACADVVAEYLGGRWPQLRGSLRPELRAFLLNELLTRCPGFSTREYRIALTKRLVVRGLLPKQPSRRSVSAYTTGVGGLQAGTPSS